jgi:hypothetical protein
VTVINKQGTLMKLEETKPIRGEMTSEQPRRAISKQETEMKRANIVVITTTSFKPDHIDP